MPNKTTTDGNYRYAFQGQEKDPETGMEAFELRLWDGRIGRWLTVDPYHEFDSPYLGMGNNPISLTDPDGGSTEKPPKYASCPNEFYFDSSDNTFYNADGNGGWTEIGAIQEVFVSKNNYYQNSQGFYVPTFNKGGAKLPDNVDRYLVLENIDGKLYHKNTGSSIFGDVEKKEYNPSSESFFTEVKDNAVPGGKGVGKVSTVLAAKTRKEIKKQIEKVILKVQNRVFNVTKQNSPIWSKLQNGGNGRRVTGSGKNKKYYEWDYTHNDIEVYNSRGIHLGSMNPTSGEMYKSAVEGRTIKF